MLKRLSMVILLAFAGLLAACGPGASPSGASPSLSSPSVAPSSGAPSESMEESASPS
ncbi:MAG TPA: hypothetical protein VH813_10870 [Candidatus Limnocylindrales bacterium]|jgi:hypothetical protein